MKRAESQYAEPEPVAVERSEIDAVEVSQFSKGYWSRTLNFLRLLPSSQAVKVPFRPGKIPRGVEKSIYAAAARKGLKVSVYVRDAAVYICGSDQERTSLAERAPEIRCRVCNAVIENIRGGPPQYVCAGFKRKTECQKTWRYAREHGVSVEEARRIRAEFARDRKRLPS